MAAVCPATSCSGVKMPSSPYVIFSSCGLHCPVFWEALPRIRCHHLICCLSIWQLLAREDFVNVMLSASAKLKVPRHSQRATRRWLPSEHFSAAIKRHQTRSREANTSCERTLILLRNDSRTKKHLWTLKATCTDNQPRTNRCYTFLPRWFST